MIKNKKEIVFEKSKSGKLGFGFSLFVYEQALLFN